MQRSQVKIVLLAVILTVSSAGHAAAPEAAISGVVRDAQGVAQMGALVQVLAGDSVVLGKAFTDLHGRYLISNLLPGKYDVRASAALYVPAMRDNLQLRPGAKAVVNLTLNALFDTAAWLPAERRKADEPDDDWKWTLRSAANRPILRLVDDGEVLMVSSSVTEPHNAVERARASVTTGDGGFGSGGIHNVFALDRALPDGADSMVRADLGTTPGPFSRGPSTEVAAGYQRRIGFAGEARTVMTYQSHPEMIGSGRTNGLEALQVATAQKTELGDMLELEVGSALIFVRTADYAVASRPFLRVTAHPVDGWSAGYRMATSRNLQTFAGLDSVQLELPVAVVSRGRMEMESGLHQEIAVGRKAGKGSVQLALYQDNLNRVLVAGGGALSQTDLKVAGTSGSNSSGIIADTVTDNFRFLNAGYKTQGINVSLTEPLTPALWVALEYSRGAALSKGDGAATTLPDVATDLTPQAASTVTVAVKGRVVHSGTKVRASYRWQPERLVTAVDPYREFSDQAYLSFYVRQPIHCGSLLPAGLDATIDVTNLLSQGYRPFLSSDGHTLFLAQAPRTIQAGLAFSF